jgi:hypothetical protein
MKLSYVTALLFGWCAADCFAADNFVSGTSAEADRKVTTLVNQFDVAAAERIQRRSPFSLLGERTPASLSLAGHSRRVSCNQHHVAVQQNLVAVPAGFVVTPLAIPVGVPVASQSYVQYGYQSATVGYGAPIQPSVQAAPMGAYAADPGASVCRCGQQQPMLRVQQSSCAGSCQLPANPPAQQLPAQDGPTPMPPDGPAPAMAGPLLTANCSKCHTGDAAKGNFRVDLPLTCEAKLAAINALLDDREDHRMPKGVKLDPLTLGKLIQELSK